MDTVYVSSREALERCRRSIEASWWVAVDLETNGLSCHDNDILLIQLCGNHDGVPYVIPRHHLRGDEEALRRLLQLLKERVWIGHNLAFDAKFMYVHFGMLPRMLWDTQLAEQVLRAGLEQYSCGLEATVYRHLGVTLDKTFQRSFVGADPALFVPTQAQIAYAGQDVALLHKLRELQLLDLKDQGLLDVALLEFALLPAFVKMHTEGLCLDVEDHKHVIDGAQKDRERYSKEALELLAPHWRRAQSKKIAQATVRYAEISTKIQGLLQPYGGRLSAAVPEDVRLEVETLRKVRARHKPKPAQALSLTSNPKVKATFAEAGVALPDVRKETLAKNRGVHPAVAALADWKEVETLCSRYGESLRACISPRTRRIHASYSQVVSTGRTSASGPCVQQLPASVRQCFKPRPGYRFVICDLANVELRVCAALANDQNMLDVFRQGRDMHAVTAANAWPEVYAGDWTKVDHDGAHRRMAKVANFLSVYGGSAQTLYRGGNAPDLATAERVIEGLYKAFPTMVQWMQRQAVLGLTLRHAKTAMGRKRFFNPIGPMPSDEDARRKWYRAKGEIKRAAANMVIQGTAADLVKRAIVLMDGRLPPEAHLVAFVHDECVLECPSDMTDDVSEIIRACMLEAGREMLGGKVDTIVDIVVNDCWQK